MSRRPPAPVPADPTLAALRGNATPRPYDSRAIVRATFNPECQILPAAAAMAVSMDTLAQYAHAAGLGPEPRRAMGQLARAQGKRLMRTCSRPARRCLTHSSPADGWRDRTSRWLTSADHVPPPTAAVLTGSGGKPGEAVWRHYHTARGVHHARGRRRDDPADTNTAAARCRRDHRVRGHAGALLRASSTSRRSSRRNKGRRATRFAPR